MGFDSVLNELFFGRWFSATFGTESEAKEIPEPVPVTNMMREKKNRVLGFTPIPLFDVKLGGYRKARYPFDYLTKTIAEKFVCPLLMEGKEEEVMSHIEPEFMPHDTNLAPNPRAHCLYENGMLPITGFAWIVNDPFLSHEKEVRYIYFSAKKDRMKKSSSHGCWFRTEGTAFMCYVDWPRFLAECIVFSKVLLKLKALKGMEVADREDDMFYDELIRKRVREVTIPAGESFMREQLERLGLSVEYAADKRRHIGAVDELDIAIHLMRTRFVFTPEMIRLAIAGGYSSLVPRLCAELYMKLVGSYQEDKQTYRYCKETESGYAASFEEKKNIPQKTREAMQKSAFRSYFSTVEYDETVELEKADRVANDFSELAKLFKLPFLDGYSLRFRLLGKHHAVGLYFPFHRCLCVDVREPSSMAHELLHLLDFKLGCKSKGVSFQGIRQRYEVLVEMEVKKSPDLLSRWNGGSKYNKKYYLEPTEVFARCGELYLTRVLNLQNSCVSKESATGFAYPENETFLGKVTEYFDELFQINSSERKAA